MFDILRSWRPSGHCAIKHECKDRLHSFVSPSILAPQISLSDMKCPWCFTLPWLVETGVTFSKQILSSILLYLFFYWFTSDVLVLANVRICKDRLPIFKTSSVINSFKYQCYAGYINRTTPPLERGISQCIPAFIRRDQLMDNLHKSLASGSDTMVHLINNCQCARVYWENMFTMLSRLHSKFRLSVENNFY